MKTLMLYSCLLLLSLCYTTYAWGQENQPPNAKDDSFSVTNQSVPDEVVYVEMNFLANDKFLDKDQLKIKILSQTDQQGKAYLIENNTLMVYYPYEETSGVDSIRYQICNAYQQCSQAYIMVEVLDPNKVELIIPSAFSPNNDGQNDRFYIKGIENYPENQLIIFSRWGTKIFNYKNYSNQNAWDGGYKNASIKLGPGDKLPKGTYFYKLIIKDKEYVKSGYVIINY